MWYLHYTIFIQERKETMKRLMMLLVGLSLPVWAGYDFTITNGYFETKTLIENQTLLMTGGGGYHLALFDKSYASIQNTSLLSEGTGGIWEIQIAGYSSLDFLGGQVHRLDVSSYAYIYIYNGQIDQIYSSQNATHTKHIEIFCQSGFNYNSTTGYLTGLWGDGSAFNIKLINVDGYSPTIDNIKFTIIPEPATMLLLAVGGMLIRRK